MLIREFEERTGYYPSAKEYETIEWAYHEFHGDKDAFCEAYKENKDGLAQRIQRIANAEAAKDELVASKKVSLLEEKISALQALLETEQEWKPYEDSRNVSQADYGKLADDAQKGLGCRFLSDDEARKLVCREFDFAPDKVTIIHEIDEYEINRHNQLRKTGKKIWRRPVYCATDYYYIRFNTTHWQYEVWNGELHKFG